MIPLLGWCALRNAPREALVQMLVVLAFAILLTTYGHGPFACVPADYDLPVDARGIVLATFTIACALVVVPLMLTVGQQLENARQVAAERDMVQNIVNGATGIAIIGTDEAGPGHAVQPRRPAAARLREGRGPGPVQLDVPHRAGDRRVGREARRAATTSSRWRSR